MPELIQNLVGHIEGLGVFAYVIIAVIVLLETIIGIGQFIPGSVILVFAGFLCYLQVYDFDIMVGVVFVVHFLGELANYYIGRTKGRALFSADARFFKLSYLQSAERLLHHAGIKVYVASQFLGMLRPVVSVVAGATHLPLVRFAAPMAVAAFIWSLVHVGLGFLFGASWQRAVHYLEQFPLLIIVSIIAVTVSGWLIRRLSENAGLLGVWLEQASRRIHRSNRYQSIARRSPRLFGFLEARLSLSRPWGFRATLGWLTAAALGICFILMMHAVAYGGWWRGFDLRVAALSTQMHSAASGRFLIPFAASGSAALVIVLAVALAVVCASLRQMKSVLTILGATTLAGIVPLLLQLLVVPNHADVAALWLACGGGFTLAVAFYLSLFLWIWNNPGNPGLRKTLGFVIFTGLAMQAYARVYMDVLYPSDVVAGLCLGVSAVIVFATVAQNLHRVTERRVRADLAALAIVCATAAASIATAWTTPRMLPSGANPVGRVDDTDSTATLLARLPRAAESLGGSNRAPIDVAFVGSPEPVVKRLLADGWRTVLPRDFVTTQVRSPIFPLFIDNRPAAWTLEKPVDGSRRVLRIWDAGNSLRGTPIYPASIVTEVRRPRFFGLHTHRLDPDLDATLDAFTAEASPSATARLRGFRPRMLYQWKRPFFTHGDILLIDTTRDQ